MATSLGMARDEVTNGSRACAAMVREVNHHKENLARWLDNTTSTIVHYGDLYHSIIA